MTQKLSQILSHFVFSQDGVFETSNNLADFEVHPLGEGLINDTYRVSHPALAKEFVLQKINTNVFPQPEQIMNNIRTLTQHFAQQQSAQELCLPTVLQTSEDKDLYLDENGDPWRVSEFIAGTVTHQTLPDNQHAAALGRALGEFHRISQNIPVDSMYDTLPGFHIAPDYYQLLCETEKIAPQSRMDNADVAQLLEFIHSRQSLIHCLENAKGGRQLPIQIIHGDPKLNNFLFDEEEIKVKSIIDLDTVKPGLSHYDIGDCIRSACNPLGEDPASLDDIAFNIHYCETILHNYLEIRARQMSTTEIDMIPSACQLLPLELAIRFLTDYLNGNRYFKVNHETQNLHRAMGQIRLCRQMESQSEAIQCCCEVFKSG
jgi:Ser/Thr protein kinase RdoA (MazF antagonist)